MKISIVEKKDLRAILELQKACYLEEAQLYDDFSIPPLTQTLESIEIAYKKEKIYKAESEEKIVGSVRGILDANTCKIGRLIVDKRFRNKGLGKQLMSHIENEFDHVIRFELFTGNKSIRNLAFYKKLGYSKFRTERINKKLELVFLEKPNQLKKDNKV